MSTVTIQLGDDKHERLEALAHERGLSITQLTEELYTIALAQHDVEARFRARAAMGSPTRLAELLTKLDRKFADSGELNS